MIQLRQERLALLLGRLFARLAREAPLESFGDFVDSRWEALHAEQAASA